MKGFTLIEVAIFLAIVGILAYVAMVGMDAESLNVSFGVNGMSETRCIAGYQHSVGAGGQARQILNEHGGGIPCK